MPGFRLAACHGAALLAVVGTYEFHLLGRDAQWQVDRLKFNFQYQDGNLQLPMLAAARV